MSIAHPPRPHGDHRPNRSDARGRARMEHRLAGFRHRSLLFELVDHEAAPTVLAMLASATALLIALLAITGGVDATADGPPPLLAWLAGLSLLAALVVGAAQAFAWLLARPVGWALARSACGLEDARAAVERLAPVHLGPEADPELRLAATRVNRAVTTVMSRLADADAAIMGYVRITDPDTREGWLGLLRQEAQSILIAAEAVDATAHLLRWIEACPWSAARPDALKLLRTDLATAERLLTEGALR